MSTFPVPAEALDEHLALIGKTGAGKTYTAKGFAEELLREGSRLCVIDPTGVWWGLKSSADGESEGFPVVVFGGDNGDVPLDEHDGEAVAGIVATTATPCVIDVSAFPSLAAQKRFITDFSEHVFRLNREALHLFVDEADAFMPQRPGPDEAVMLGRWDTIARRGRARGFRLTLITQRPAVLNKNALSQVGTLIALKLTSPQDRKAVGDWIEGNADRVQGKEILASLPGLARGDGWVWSPGHEVLERVKFGAITTWDSSRTPGKGEVHRSAKTLATADISEILAVLQTPHAQRPGEVRTMPDADALAAARKAGFDEALAACAEQLGHLTGIVRNAHYALERLAPIIAGVGEHVARSAAYLAAAEPLVALGPTHAEGSDRLAMAGLSVEAMAKAADNLTRVAADPLAPERIGAVLERAGVTHADGRAVKAADVVRVDTTTAGQPCGLEHLQPAARRLLLTLATYSGRELSRTEWGVFSSVAPKGGTFSTAIKALREAGFIDEHDALTRAGSGAIVSAYGSDLAGPRPDFAVWADHLKGTPKRMLEALRDLGGGGTHRQIASAADLTAGGGTFSSALKALRDNDLITTERHNGVAVVFCPIAEAEHRRITETPA